MQELRVRHLPVIDQGKLVGLITDRDIKLVLGPDFAYPSEGELTVRDVQVADPYVADVAAPLDGVLETMARKHIGSVLVTRDGELAGIFTVTDACRYLSELLRGRR
jgi:acetoin utilization protein AcuB